MQHQNVSEMMNTWTSQKGFPLVTVSRNGDQVTLTQEHFLLTSDNATRTSRSVGLSHTDLRSRHNADCTVHSLQLVEYSSDIREGQL